MTTVKTVKTWFNIHKWTSLICTLFLLMLCLTGLPLIFSEEIEHLSGNEAAAPPMPEGTPELNMDTILQAALKQRPGEVIRYAFWDEEEHPHMTLVSMADSMSAPPEVSNLVTIDNRTAKILQEPNYQEGFMYVMRELHINMFAGIPGKLFLGLMGILFFVAIVSGVILYGPIMKNFDFGMIRTHKAPRLKWLDMHNLLGIVTLTWATVVGITGSINTLAEPMLAIWRMGDLAEMVKEYKDRPPLEGELASLEQSLKTVKAAAPEMKVSFVAYPGTLFSSNHHYSIFLKGTTPVTSRLIKPALIDAKTGTLTELRDLPWFLNTILISQPLHFGDYGGLPLKIIWTLFDIATIVVLITGLYLWVARRKAAKEHFKRLEQSESIAIASVMEKGDGNE